MSSDIKPKVICKNLEDIIKGSLFSTKRSSIQNSDLRQSSQRKLNSEPRQRRSTERCHTSASRGNRLYESGTRLNTSISKHSLESKEKIKILESKVSLNNSAKKYIEQKRSRHTVVPTSAVEFYPSQGKKAQRQASSVPTAHLKSLYFNQVDAILTELQDFIREKREKICLQMNFMNQESLADMLSDQLTDLSSIFKSQLQGLIGRSLYPEIDNQVLKPKNRITQTNQKSKLNMKTNSSSKQIKPKIHFQQQLIKIEQFMLRQNTVNSTINSEPHDDPYIPTQTDAQILSMLVYKNKVNSTKRKIQSSDSYGHELMSPWVKSGRSNKDGDGQYSFRNRNSKQRDFTNTMKEADMKKKKNQHNPVEKSSNKENREKSIYQMVLQENKKGKTDWKMK